METPAEKTPRKARTENEIHDLERDNLFVEGSSFHVEEGCVAVGNGEDTVYMPRLAFDKLVDWYNGAD